MAAMNQQYLPVLTIVVTGESVVVVLFLLHRNTVNITVTRIIMASVAPVIIKASSTVDRSLLLLFCDSRLFAPTLPDVGSSIPAE